MASKLTRVELHSLKITIPYSVIQVWNDLEVGQVVKLPSKDDKDELVTLLAHRDGPEVIEFEFTKSAASILKDGHAARVRIAKVEQTYLDALNSATSSPPKQPQLDHDAQVAKPTTGVAKQPEGNTKNTDPKGESKSTEKEQNPTISVETPSAKKNKNSHISPEKNDNLSVVATATPPLLHGLGLVSKATAMAISSEPKTPKIVPAAVNLNDSENSMDSQSSVSKASSGSLPVKRHAEESPDTKNGPMSQKRSRGPKQYQCDLCDQTFVYLTSFQKHIWKHAKEAKAQGVSSLNLLGQISALKTSASLQTVSPSGGNQSVLVLSGGKNQNPTPIHIQPKLEKPELPNSPNQLSPINFQPLVTSGGDITHSEYSSPMKLSQFNQSSSEYQQNPVPHLTSPYVQGKINKKQENITTMSMEDDPNCWICSRNFTYRTSFIKHMRTEHQVTVVMEDQNHAPKNTAFHCLICHDKFSSAESYSQHMLQSHGISGSLPSGKFHATRSLSEKMAQTSSLPSSANQDPWFSNLQAAIADATNATMAEMAEKKAEQLLTLQLKENGEYVIVDDQFNEVILGESLLCCVCLKMFQYKQSFLSHMRQSHSIQVVDDTENVVDGDHGKSEESTYCGLCCQKFTDNISLEKHMKENHSDSEVVLEKNLGAETLFSCQICATLHPTESALSQHLLTAHGIENNSSQNTAGPKILFCPDCPARFKFPSALEFHLVDKHGLSPEQKGDNQNYSYYEEDSSEDILGLEVLGPDDLSDRDESASDSDYGNVPLVNDNLDIPERVLSPGGKSMIKCALCEKTFKFTIAYQKHVKFAHFKDQNGNKVEENGSKSPSSPKEDIPTPDGSIPIPGGSTVMPGGSTSVPEDSTIDVSGSTPKNDKEVSKEGEIEISPSEKKSEYGLEAQTEKSTVALTVKNGEEDKAKNK